jgi:hypothetical protein
LKPKRNQIGGISQSIEVHLRAVEEVQPAILDKEKTDILANALPF